MNISLSDPDLLAVTDEKTGEISYGCDQEWFTHWWQRLAGCGTSVAASIVLYPENKRRAAGDLPRITEKKQALLLMEELWEYVTPTAKGVNTTKLFYGPLASYLESKGLKYRYKFLDLPAEKNERPALKEAADFIAEALSLDVPVAFLNLSRGEEVNLDEWHWVTIIALDDAEEETGKQFFVRILDEGRIKKIDFSLWYNTTKKDGGLVYFSGLQPENVQAAGQNG